MLIASEEIVTEMIVIVMHVIMTVLTGEVTAWMIVVTIAMGQEEEMNRAVTSGGGNHHPLGQKGSPGLLLGVVVNDHPQSSLIQKAGQQFSISEQMCSTLAINRTDRQRPSQQRLESAFHLHSQYKEIDSSTDAAIAYWLLY